MSKQQHNGDYRAPDTQRDPDEVRDELDVYDRVTRPAASASEFETTNFGLGYYAGEQELYQQVESYRDGMYARAAFGKAIRSRAMREAREQYLRDQYETHAGATSSRDFDEWVAENADEWDSLSEDEKAAQVRKYVGIEPDWSPPQWRMAEMRLEVSRGRDARLLDNVFGRVVEKITNGAEAAKEALADLK